eukprot:4083413-Prymnesium_polylepis.1
MAGDGWGRPGTAGWGYRGRRGTGRDRDYTAHAKPANTRIKTHKIFTDTWPQHATCAVHTGLGPKTS